MSRLRFDPVQNTPRLNPRYDADGAAYAAAVSSSNRLPEMTLVKAWKAGGCWTKIVRCFLMGHANATYNNTCIKTLATPGSFVANGGTVTHAAGYVQFASNAYYNPVENLSTLVSVNAHGLAYDPVDIAAVANVCAIGGQDASFSNHILPNFSGTGLYRVGNDSTAALSAATPGSRSLILYSRTSATNAKVYAWDGSSLSTVASSTGLSGGGVMTRPAFLAAYNGIGVASSYANNKNRLHLTHSGFNDAEALAFCQALQAYYVAKGWV